MSEWLGLYQQSIFLLLELALSRWKIGTRAQTNSSIRAIRKTIL